jgi:hypothetical protein
VQPRPVLQHQTHSPSTAHLVIARSPVHEQPQRLLCRRARVAPAAGLQVQLREHEVGLSHVGVEPRSGLKHALDLLCVRRALQRGV